MISKEINKDTPIYLAIKPDFFYNSLCVNL